MSWELTRREFIKGSIYLPSAVKAWMNEQIDGGQDKQKIYTAFMPFVAAGAKELSMLEIKWFRGDLVLASEIDTLYSSDENAQPKIKECNVWVTRIKGVGMPSGTDILESKGDNQDGITWKSSNLEPREIELMVNLSGTFPQLWSARRFLVQRFSPINSLGFDGYLEFTTPVGDRREIYLRYKSGLQFDDLPEDATGMQFPLRLWAQDPLFIDITGKLENHVMTVPPFTETYTISNEGDWDLFPGIGITANVGAGGNVINPLLENLTTGESIQLTYTLPLAGQIAYQLDYGDKDITVGGVSILNNLAANNDLGSFHLQPGDNNIRVTIDAASTGVAETDIFWQERYLSV